MSPTGEASPILSELPNSSYDGPGLPSAANGGIISVNRFRAKSLISERSRDPWKPLPFGSAVSQIESLSHTHLPECYSAQVHGRVPAGGAPMELAAGAPMRLLQLGDAASRCAAGSIWQCVSCQTCATRCPTEGDCAAVMDALRQSRLRARRGFSRRTPHGALSESFSRQTSAAMGAERDRADWRVHGMVFLRDRSVPFLFRRCGWLRLQKRRQAAPGWREAGPRRTGGAHLRPRRLWRRPNEPRLLSGCALHGSSKRLLAVRCARASGR